MNSSEKILELLDDNLFVEWLSSQTDELDTYWLNKLSGDDELLREIQSFKSTWRQIQIEEPTLSTKHRIVCGLIFQIKP